jgi:hypothetical protein
MQENLLFCFESGMISCLASLRRKKGVATKLVLIIRSCCKASVVQVYQHTFPDAFAAILDLPPGPVHPKVYFTA